ncbi:hydroxysteroid dehydrogenase-like protein 2 [Serinus canaria]|uniref:hydroxysteroid dehydrogenase-like protein 2 n=1 Tax=Serinus canaria TaxID=9135 RepID=UPI0021CC7D31|nr:hydroxysteroid dehydrogenase-like protein 2 [Serinus canaria]
MRSTRGVFQFELSGNGGGTWYIDLKTEGGSAGFGKPPVTADVVMSMSSADFVKMFTGTDILAASVSSERIQPMHLSCALRMSEQRLLNGHCLYQEDLIFPECRYDTSQILL